MKRPVWLLVTILTLALTSLVLTWAGWLQAEARRPAGWRSETHAKNHDVLTSDAAWRWRRCQPTHWRACLLQHQ